MWVKSGQQLQAARVMLAALEAIEPLSSNDHPVLKVYGSEFDAVRNAISQAKAAGITTEQS